MDQPKLSFLNRLQERGLVDQWGFGFFAGVGAVGIVAAKYLHAPATWTAIGAVVVMLVYAGLISRYGSGRLRSDQAGDNCYYLGLIYTLASLAYAIFTFDPANTATTIVQGFGIALATTIVGLVLRVIFNQGRPDLEEVESGARRDLIDAVARMKTELGQAVVVMNDFSRQVRQAISETRDAATADITQFAETAVGGLKEVVDTAKGAMQTEASEFASRAKRHGAAVDRLVTSLEKHGENLDRLSDSHDRISATIGAIADSGDRAREATGVLSSEAEAIASGLRSLRESGDIVRGSVEALSRASDAVQASVQSFNGEVGNQLEQLKTAPADAIARSTDAMTQASAAVRAELEGLARSQQSASSALSDQAAAALAAIRRHNDSMEVELSRSREMFLKVQENLVDMTGELARQVEARR